MYKSLKVSVFNTNKLLRNSKINLNTLLFVVILCSITGIQGCDSTQSDWEKANHSKSISEIREFLKKYPNSKYDKVAKSTLDSLEWTPQLIEGSTNEFRLKFVHDTILTFNILEQNFYWNKKEIIYSIGNQLAFVTTQNGSIFAIGGKDPDNALDFSFPEGMRVEGDFAFGNLKFYNSRASRTEVGGILFLKGTELVFSSNK